MLELSRGIERIDVHDHHARPQNAQNRDRRLQQIGQHDCDAIAAAEARQRLKIGGECGTQRIDLGIRQYSAAIRESRPLRIGGQERIHERRQRLVSTEVNRRRYAVRVLVEPGLA